MTKHIRSTADYKIMEDANGRQYRFFCGISGAVGCTTKPIPAKTQEEELEIAWEGEGKKYFNICHKCGKWVCDAMYNPDVWECVDCAPLEDKPHFCLHCGVKISELDIFCRRCGTRLLYGEEEWSG